MDRLNASEYRIYVSVRIEATESETLVAFKGWEKTTTPLMMMFAIDQEITLTLLLAKNSETPLSV